MKVVKAVSEPKLGLKPHCLTVTRCVIKARAEFCQNLQTPIHS